MKPPPGELLVLGHVEEPRLDGQIVALPLDVPLTSARAPSTDQLSKLMLSAVTPLLSGASI